jgi:hypothetical protein
MLYLETRRVGCHVYGDRVKPGSTCKSDKYDVPEPRYCHCYLQLTIKSRSMGVQEWSRTA